MNKLSKIIFPLATTILMLLVLGYYVWVAATNGTTLVTKRDGAVYFGAFRHDEVIPGEPHYGFYNLMADAFLAGKVSLLVEPPPELLRLPNPYDPQANSAYRLNDASLYKGRYYLYFGPVPALVLFIPFRLLPFGMITEPFAVALFGFGAFLFAALTLVQLARKLSPAVSNSLLFLAILALGTSNAMPFVLRRPIVYEVAITAGAFFLMLGFFVLVRSWLKKGGLSRQTMVLLSLCWGLAVGCRVLYVFAGIGLLIIWILLLAERRERTLRGALVDALCLCLPFALCVFALGLYNFVRFDSWTEFGVNHHLTMGVIPPEAFFRAENLKPGLYLNMLRSPQPDIYFPFFRLRTGSPIALANYHSVEPVGGFFLTSPIMIFLFAGWRKSGAIGIRGLVGLMTGMGLGILLFESFLLPGTSMRYQVDFIFPLILTALLFWLLVDASVKSRWVKIALRCVSIGLLLYGIIVHLCLGFIGYNDLFRRSHPLEYAACENFAAPVTRVLFQVSTRGWPAIRGMFSPASTPSPAHARKAHPMPSPTPVPTATPTPTPAAVSSITPPLSLAAADSVAVSGVSGYSAITGADLPYLWDNKSYRSGKTCAIH